MDDLLDAEAEVLVALGRHRSCSSRLGDRQRGRTRIVAMLSPWRWRRRIARRLLAALAPVGGSLVAAGVPTRSRGVGVGLARAGQRQRERECGEQRESNEVVGTDHMGAARYQEIGVRG